MLERKFSYLKRRQSIFLSSLLSSHNRLNQINYCLITENARDRPEFKAVEEIQDGSKRVHKNSDDRIKQVERSRSE